MHNFDPDQYGISDEALADVSWWLNAIIAIAEGSDLPGPGDPPRHTSAAALLERDRSRLKIQGPGDLVAAVPYLLGYHPSDGSLVIAELAGVEFAGLQCTDLDASTALLTALAGESRARGSDTVITIVYDGGGSESDHVGAVLRDSGLQVLERLRVHDGRWFSIDCQDACCPPEGTPVPKHAAIATALIAEGFQAKPDRDAALAGLEPVAEGIRSEIGSEVDRLRRERGPIQLHDEAAVTCQVLERLVGLEGFPEPQLIAELRFALDDIVIRNWAVMQILSGRVHRPTDLWIWVMRHLRDDLAAPAAALAAYAAFQDGKVLLVNACLDLALRADPDYRFAIILYFAVCSGITGSQLRQLHGFYK